MLTIWKYEISPDKVLSIPKGYVPLAVQTQRKAATYLWALVNPNNASKPVRVKIYGTGYDLPPDTCIENYVGTLSRGDGAFIYHVFLKDEG